MRKVCTFWIHFSSFDALALYSLADGVSGCLCLMAVCSVVGMRVLAKSLLSPLDAVSNHEVTSVASPGG